MVTKLTSVLAHLHQPDDADNCNIDMIAKYLIAIAILITVATSALADDVELYCDGRHNDGAGAPVIQTHLWLKITASEGRHAIELQGPAFEKNILALEESPTELKATQFSHDKSIEQHVVLNRQTLHLNYSVRTSPEVDHVFSGICSSYSPKI